MDLHTVRPKGRKRNKDAEFLPGAEVQSSWGNCVVIDSAGTNGRTEGYNCDFGDGRPGGWFVETRHLCL
jgi:hypothetical protein